MSEEVDQEAWLPIQYDLKHRINGETKEFIKVARRVEIQQALLYEYLYKNKLPIAFHLNKLKAYLYSIHQREEKDKFKHITKEKKYNEREFWFEEFNRVYENTIIKVEK